MRDDLDPAAIDRDPEVRALPRAAGVLYRALLAHPDVGIDGAVPDALLVATLRRVANGARAPVEALVAAGLLVALAKADDPGGAAWLVQTPARRDGARVFATGGAA